MILATTTLGSVLTVVAPILAVLLAPLLGYMASRHRASGRVDTADAETLFTTQGDMLKSYKDDAIVWRALVTKMTESTEAMRTSYEEAAKGSDRKLGEAISELQRLRDEVKHLNTELSLMRELLAKERTDGA